MMKMGELFFMLPMFFVELILTSIFSTFTESPKNARETARHQRRKVPTKKDADPMKTVSVLFWLLFFNISTISSKAHMANIIASILI